MRLPINSVRLLLCAALLLRAGTRRRARPSPIGLPTCPPNVVHMPVLHRAGARALQEVRHHGEDRFAQRRRQRVPRHAGRQSRRRHVARHRDRRSARSKGSPTKDDVWRTCSSTKPRWWCATTSRTWPTSRASGSAFRSRAASPTSISRSVLRAAKIDREGRQLRHHRHRGRAGAGRRPGRHRDPARRAGNAGEGKVPSLHAVARMWEVQPKTLYTVAVATEKTIKDRSGRSCRPSSRPISKRPASCTPTRPR